MTNLDYSGSAPSKRRRPDPVSMFICCIGGAIVGALIGLLLAAPIKEAVLSLINPPATHERDFLGYVAGYATVLLFALCGVVVGIVLSKRLGNRRIPK